MSFLGTQFNPQLMLPFGLGGNRHPLPPLYLLPVWKDSLQGSPSPLANLLWTLSTALSQASVPLGPAHGP